MAMKQRFAAQVDPDVLAKTKAIADREGREFEAIIEEALVDFVAKKTGAQPRADVLAHYEATVARYDSLFERLSK